MLTTTTVLFMRSWHLPFRTRYLILGEPRFRSIGGETIVRRSFGRMSSTTTMMSGRAVGKKLVIACDGTWQNSDQGYDTTIGAPPTAQIPTNVTRIVRALNHSHTIVDPVSNSSTMIPQIAFYQRGVGTDNLQDKLEGGLTGDSISELIREAYAFLANNFDPETQADLDNVEVPLDEIVILGFSRGAYTARAIASLVSDIGLLTKTGMESFWGVFQDWMNQDVVDKESMWFLATYPDIGKTFHSRYGRKIEFTDEEYRSTLIEAGLTRHGMPIRAVGVFDTVGALGIPLKFNAKNVKPYSFINVKVARHVQNAFHALALDEHRALFSPTLWESPTPSPSQPADKLRILKQCWFPGSHSNVGGSYPDAGVSNITLAWMISQLEDTDGGILSFDPMYLDFVQDLANQYYVKVGESLRPWGFGRLYDSSLVKPGDLVVAAMAVDPIVRTPGRYTEFDPQTGMPGSRPLYKTGECVHRCVRVRIDGSGPGPEALVKEGIVETAIDLVKGTWNNWIHPPKEFSSDVKEDPKVKETLRYDPPALRGYRLTESEAVEFESDHSRDGSSGVVWLARNETEEKDGLMELSEDVLGRTEIRLLRRSVGGAWSVK